MDFRNSFDNQIKYHYRSTPTSIHAPGVTFYEPSGGKVDSEWRTIMDVRTAGSYRKFICFSSCFRPLQPTQPTNAALRVEFWKRLSIWNESM
ncbi:conserved hypothetical protein [Coccidioides posadasii str. Silveira]|uniref:Uncharacterized protein n=1 Tax=Coccidioides posadasii (strain RMSCC 757 / Silveira) TaxID=443226 RepID=E9CZ57_COCPS|nr:conserved hypothetical protein [Coccidioides posadasii str. Silveira]